MHRQGPLNFKATILPFIKNIYFLFLLKLNAKKLCLPGLSPLQTQNRFHENTESVCEGHWLDVSRSFLVGAWTPDVRVTKAVVNKVVY